MKNIVLIIILSCTVVFVGCARTPYKGYTETDLLDKTLSKLIISNHYDSINGINFIIDKIDNKISQTPESKFVYSPPRVFVIKPGQHTLTVGFHLGSYGGNGLETHYNISLNILPGMTLPPKYKPYLKRVRSGK